MESFRGGDVGRAAELLQATLARPVGCWDSMHLAAGYLGRVPWGGYPFPDY